MTVGMKIMRPTSIAKTGASSTASIRAAGGVEFDLCETLSLNGVFTADYDDYMISIRFVASGGRQVEARLRASGSDASGGNYTYQRLSANSTTVSSDRSSSQTVMRLAFGDATQRSGLNTYIYGPNLAQPTAFRSVTVSDLSSAYIEDYAGTHSLSTAYDGISLLSNNANTFSGMITVYGYAQ